MSKLFQVSLFQALTLGGFDGEISVAELKKHGDTGIGTYSGVNGELIMVDGTTYQAFADGTVVIAPDNETVPYSGVAFFTGKYHKEISANSFNELIAKLNAIAEEYGKNMCYFVKLHAKFDRIIVRSILKQKKPYVMLNEAVKRGQREFTRENMAGTIVGLYCPEYMKGLNAVGWHCHFIADDGSIGGHVFDVSFTKGSLDIDKMDGYELYIPNTKEFNEKDFGQDLSKAIDEAEKRPGA